MGIGPNAVGFATMSNPTQPTRSILGYRIYRLRDPLGRRLAQLLPGLVLFGIALAFAIEASLGTNPWTVFAQGASDRLGISVGLMVVLTGVVLVLATRLFDEAFGLGTVLNAIIIGPVVDLTLWLIPDTDVLWIRIVLIGLAPILLGLASGLYIGAGLGPGPRDSLMTALMRRGVPTWRARTIIEATALSCGWLLGGDVGWGTLWMAASVGPWVQLFLRPLTIDRES